MLKNFVCLVCGENISIQIDLNNLTISSDCKNHHHFREMQFDDYYKFLPNSNIKEHNINNNYVFYCYICQKNVSLSNIKDHNGHDGIKLSLNEFLSKPDCIDFNSNILKNDFSKELNVLEKIIKDYTEWKIKFDKKFNILTKFFQQLYELEKNIFTQITNNNINNGTSYDYELLMNIKEIYRINHDIKEYRKNYEGFFNNNNFNKLSYFLVNKIKDINEYNEISFKDINMYYKDNKCFFNEEIKYKKERKDNIFPYIKKLFQDCKHLVGYDLNYFNGDFYSNDIYNKNIIKLNDKIFQYFLLKIKNLYPKINHLSHMRDKSYFLVSIEKKIIIIKTNLFDAQNEANFIMNEIKNISCFHYDDLTDIMFSLELTNKSIISFSEKYMYIYESYTSEEDEEMENNDNYYNNYFLKKKIPLKKQIDEVMQISSELFCTYSFLLMEIDFYSIENMEIITKLEGIEGTPGPVGTRYMTMIRKDLLIITGAEKISIISLKQMNIKAKIKTSGLVSTFCLLPNNGLLCGEINFDYNPNSPWNKGDNKYSLVQYQINENEIKRVSKKDDAHGDIIRSVFYFENNIIVSCSTKGELKIWY